MTLKTAVAWALALAIILAGNIFLFGLAQGTAFPVLFFLFMALVLGTALFILRHRLVHQGDLAFLLAAVLILCLALTFPATAYKSYQKEQSSADASADIPLLEAQNKYYADFLAYQRAQVASLQQSSNELQQEITALQKDQAAVQPQVTVQPATTQPFEDDEEESFLRDLFGDEDDD